MEKKNKPAETRSERRQKVMKLQDGTLTVKQMAEVENAVHARIKEFLDGYIIVGFIAGAKNEPIFLHVYEDAKTCLALQQFCQQLDLFQPEPDGEDYEQDEDDDGPAEAWKQK